MHPEKGAPSRLLPMTANEASPSVGDPEAAIVGTPSTVGEPVPTTCVAAFVTFATVTRSMINGRMLLLSVTHSRNVT